MKRKKICRKLPTSVCEDGLKVGKAIIESRKRPHVKKTQDGKFLITLVRGVLTSDGISTIVENISIVCENLKNPHQKCRGSKSHHTFRIIAYNGMIFNGHMSIGS